MKADKNNPYGMSDSDIQYIDKYLESMKLKFADLLKVSALSYAINPIGRKKAVIAWKKDLLDLRLRYSIPEFTIEIDTLLMLCDTTLQDYQIRDEHQAQINRITALGLGMDHDFAETFTAALDLHCNGDLTQKQINLISHNIKKYYGTNKHLRFNAMDLQIIANRLVAGGFINDTDTFVTQFSNEQFNHKLPKILWSKANGKLIYFIEQIRKDRKCPYKPISEVFELKRNLTAGQRSKNGYDEIDTILTIKK